MNQHVCRCCLLENPTLMYNIFDNNLRDSLLQCAPNVHIEPDDGLPEVICNLCWLRVRDAVDFRRKCEETDCELRKRYDETNKAIEEALGLDGLAQLEQTVNGMMLQNLDDVTGQEGSGSGVELIGDAQVLPEFDSLEMSVLNDLLLEDYSFSSIPETIQPTRLNEDDATINELLNNVLNNANFDNTSDSFLPQESLERTFSELSTNTSTTTTTASELSSFINALELENISSSNSCSSSNSNSCSSSNSSTLTNVSTASVVTSVKTPTTKTVHPCTECEKKFTRNFQLKLHLISVHNIGDGLQYNCEVCQKTFASRHSLNYHHKSIHSSERPFACDHCQRRFVLRTQLASHMRTHTGESKPRIFECAECGKCWPTKSDLRTHLRCHDPAVERPFKCANCEKRFFTRGHLSSHLLVHTGEKPYACAFCSKSYQSVGNLNNHMVRRHEDLLLAGRRTEVALQS